MKHTIFTFFIGAVLLWLPVMFFGCAPVGPDYQAPDAAGLAPEAWHSPLEGGLSEKEPDSQWLASWWNSLEDPILTILMEKAVQNNLDLELAVLRVQEARARRGMVNAELFPTLDGSGSAVWTRSSQETGTGKTNDIYTTGFDAGWELDVFGGLRRSVEAYDAEVEASQASLQDVLVSLTAEVALNYIEVRTYQSRLEAAQANVELQKETYQLTVWQDQAGLSDELATQEALYSLESTKSQIPVLQSGLEEAMNRVAVLLGEKPGMVHEALTEKKPVPAIPLSVDIGVPAEVLRRRPDIRQAERELAAQTARVGVATAELYPKFVLNGSIVVTGDSLNRMTSNLTTTENWTLSGGPQIRWNLFDAGAIRKNIQIQSVLQEQALVQYESAVLSALEEVENTLVAYANEQKRRGSLELAAQAAQQAAQLAQLEYQAGWKDFTSVLIAQRSLLNLQDELTQSQGTVTANLVRLYKVLGGGWPYAAENEIETY